MQINSLLPQQPGTAQVRLDGESGKARSPLESMGDGSLAAEGEAEVKTDEGGVSTRLSAQALRSDTDYSSPVFAEIWVGDQKVAQVDARGDVTSLNGLPLPQMNGSAGNPGLAAQRAAQVARMVGGEVRQGGLKMDGQTLNNQIKLRSVYGL